MALSNSFSYPSDLLDAGGYIFFINNFMDLIKGCVDG